jgi:hypothetical protein
VLRGCRTRARDTSSVVVVAAGNFRGGGGGSGAGGRKPRNHITTPGVSSPADIAPSADHEARNPPAVTRAGRRRGGGRRISVAPAATPASSHPLALSAFAHATPANHASITCRPAGTVNAAYPLSLSYAAGLPSRRTRSTFG